MHNDLAGIAHDGVVRSPDIEVEADFARQTVNEDAAANNPFHRVVNGRPVLDADDISHIA